MATRDSIQREVLPIPDRKPIGLTTYDAKDPETKYPPITPLRYLTYDSVVVLSGVTAVLPTLKDQMANILPRIEGSLKDAGTSWERAVKASFLLHRSQTFETLSELFQQQVKAKIPHMEYFHVDGYSSEGKLIEIEITATV